MRPTVAGSCVFLLAATTSLVGADQESATLSAKDKLAQLQATSASITNVSATLLLSVLPLQGRAPDWFWYSRSTTAEVTRIEFPKYVTRNGIVSTNVAYAMLIDTRTKHAFASANERLATLKPDASWFWIQAADALLGPAFNLRTDPGNEVAYSGQEMLNGHEMEVFSVSSNGIVRQVLWVARENGIVYKTKLYNVVYELTEIKTNSQLDDKLFALAATGEQLQELSEDDLRFWVLARPTAKITSREIIKPTIHTAARAGDVKAVEGFLTANKYLVDATDENCMTPLHLAAVGGDVATVRLLLAKGADIDARADRGGTALYFACTYGHVEVANLLLSRKAKIDTPLNDGWTALHSAVFKYHKDIVQLLLRSGAAVNPKTKGGRTPLDVAIEQGYTDIAETLRQHAAVGE